MNLKVVSIAGFRLLVDTSKGKLAMDPVTAINNGIAELFAFLSTPQGQLVVADFRALNKDISTKLMDLFNHLHSQTIPKQS